MALSDAALSASTLAPARLFFADFADLPLRYAYAPFPLKVAPGTPGADPDCAGFTFETMDAGVIAMSEIEHGADGTQGVTVTLNASMDQPELRAALEDPALYAGRLFRVWNVLHDGAGNVTAVSPSLGFTGYMSHPVETVDPAAGTMAVSMEMLNWQAIFGAPPCRTYLLQIDPADLSGKVSIGNAAAAPGLSGGGRGEPRNLYEQLR